MTDEFEWHTDVDGEWEPPLQEPKRRTRPLSRSVRIFLLTSAACLLLVVSLVVYRSLSGRVTEATNTAESGLLLAHDLLISGALKGDSDLVDSVVASRPSSWHDLNDNLLNRQLFFSRRPLGIEVLRDDGLREVAGDDIHLAPELDAAEIVDRRPYSVLLGQGLTATVTLERVFAYERADDQWRLAPPPDEAAFWGNWITDERQYVTVTYPERDEAVALKLAAYLDDLLPALCSSEGMSCPANFNLNFKLEREPNSVLRLGEGLFAISASSASTGSRLVLPAPTLVGKPVDEAGYEALQQGYAGWICAAIFASYGSAGYEVDDVLAQFDLRPPPAPVRPLPRPALSSLPLGATPPEQDVLLLCSDDSVDRLLRFETSNGQWREEAPGEQWGGSAGESDAGAPRGSYLTRLPDYQGAIIQTGGTVGGQQVWRSYLWRAGSAIFLTQEHEVHYYLPPRLQPASRQTSKLAFYVPPTDEDGLFSALVVDLDECASSPCIPRSLAAMPVWSPEGSWTLLIAPAIDGRQMLSLGDENGESLAEIGSGQSAFWLDERSFVYVSIDRWAQRDTLGRWPARQVVLATLGEEQPPVISTVSLFDAEMVRLAMPAAIRPETLSLWLVQPALHGDQTWFIAASGMREGTLLDYIAVANPFSGEVVLAAPMEEYHLVESPMVSPTGQQAIAIGLSADGSKISIELVDAVTGDMRRLPDLVPQDWSADGNWIIQLDQGLIQLTSTTNDVVWTIRHGLSTCYSAVWTNREGE
jgi:hypothetical protein